MYSARMQMGRAQASYQDVALTSRVEGASPHQLIAIMFDEALKSLEAMAAAAVRRDFTRLGSAQARSLSIVGGLQASLDMERGGDLARNLASVYREARRLILASGKSCDGKPALEARAMLAEIASAWEAIG
jgi:flagellar secretion chaperone FliS